ncbi:MAG: hypothetical protein PHD48_06450 [Alphaproteobacteria bacterium]|nr:hypothetical protein [Alphaproteobacteria bacterium]
MFPTFKWFDKRSPKNIPLKRLYHSINWAIEPSLFQLLKTPPNKTIDVCGQIVNVVAQGRGQHEFEAQEITSILIRVAKELYNLVEYGPKIQNEEHMKAVETWERTLDLIAERGDFASVFTLANKDISKLDAPFCHIAFVVKKIDQYAQFNFGIDPEKTVENVSRALRKIPRGDLSLEEETESKLLQKSLVAKIANFATTYPDDVKKLKTLYEAVYEALDYPHSDVDSQQSLVKTISVIASLYSEEEGKYKATFPEEFGYLNLNTLFLGVSKALASTEPQNDTGQHLQFMFYDFARQMYKLSPDKAHYYVNLAHKYYPGTLVGEMAQQTLATYTDFDKDRKLEIGTIGALRPQPIGFTHRIGKDPA